LNEDFRMVTELRGFIFIDASSQKLLRKKPPSYSTSQWNILPHLQII